MAFYVVDNPRFDDTGFAYGEDFGEINLGSALKCELCGSTLTSLKWLPPYEIRVSRKKLGDFIYGTFSNFIVSARFKSLFEKEGLKGIESFNPVSIFFRKKLLDESYFLPEIVLSNVQIDLERSGFVFEGNRRCPACQKSGSIIKKWNGVVLEEPDRIDLDIFNTKVLPGTMIVSEHFKNFVERHEFSNIWLIEASKYKTSWTVS